MKVKELIEKLSKMDPEMEVRVTDTYWESEGYYETEVSERKQWEDEHPTIEYLTIEEGSVLLF